MSRAATPRSSSSWTPFKTAWNGSLGVEGTLVIVISPESSLKKTKSENVPPVSTVTRYLAIVSLAVTLFVGRFNEISRLQCC